MWSIAGAGVEGTPRGRSSTCCEQRDNGPTLTTGGGGSSWENFVFREAAEICPWRTLGGIGSAVQGHHAF